MDYNIIDSWVEWYNKRIKKEDPRRILDKVRSALSKALNDTNSIDSIGNVFTSIFGDYRNIIMVIGRCEDIIKSLTIGNEVGTFATEGTIFITGVDYVFGFRIEFTVWDHTYNGSIFIGVDRDFDNIVILKCTNFRVDKSYNYTLLVYDREEKGEKH